MNDNRTIFFIIGLLLAAVATGMLLPALADLVSGHDDWQVFVASALVTGFIAGALILTNRGDLPPLSVKQAFLLTSLSWLALTGFAALPFAFSAQNLSYTDAFFEAMSGLTTTGATILTGLDSARLAFFYGALCCNGLAVSVLSLWRFPCCPC
jgi:trk system potassium uptake protein TrkH